MMVRERSAARVREEWPRVRCRLPLLLYRGLVIRRGRDLVELDLLFGAARRVERATTLMGDGWHVVPIGPFRLAVRCLM